MKKILTLTLCLALLLGLFSGCGGKQYDPLAGVETTVFTDDAGRDVTVPAGITRIAASGSTAQMILMTLVPELLVGLASSPSTAQRPYFPAEMWTLPTFGQFYGSKANLNMESLIAAQPQLIMLDIMLPGLDGYELLDAMCGLEVSPDRPLHAPGEDTEYYQYNP